jgi:uncharacterized protein YjiS (DUF1127 family)
MSRSHPAAGAVTTADGSIAAREAWLIRWSFWPRHGVAMLKTWQMQRHTHRLLSKFSDYELADIGLSRIDIDRWRAEARLEIEKRFWRF